jgi:hypothetical protein
MLNLEGFLFCYICLLAVCIVVALAATFCIITNIDVEIRKCDEECRMADKEIEECDKLIRSFEREK